MPQTYNYTIIGEKIILSVSDLKNFNEYVSKTKQDGEATIKYFTQDIFFRVFFEKFETTAFHQRQAMELRLAINHPDLFRLLESSTFSGSFLSTLKYFRFISDDVQVLTELGKRNWYESLCIDLNKFKSPPSLVYPVVAHFNLTHLEIEMKCHEIEALHLHMPQLRTLIIMNWAICEHTEKCVASVLIQCSENIEILDLTNVIIHNDEIISKLTKLFDLTLIAVRLYITDAGIERFVSNLSAIRSLWFVEMFGERSVQLFNEIFKRNLTDMPLLHRLRFPLEGNIRYNFGLNANSNKIHVVVYSALFDTPNRNLFTFFQALRSGFLGESCIHFRSFAFEPLITKTSFVKFHPKMLNDAKCRPYLKILYGRLGRLHGDELQLRKNIDYLRKNGRFSI